MWWRAISRWCAAALSLLTTLDVAVRAVSAQLPHGAQIAFVSAHGDALSDIKLTEVDRGIVINLTERLSKVEARYLSPAWSPDGRWLAFTSTYQGSFKIFLMDAETYAIHPLLPDDAILSPYWEPQWSPDGRWLGFKTYAGWVDSAEIFISEVGSSHAEQISHEGVVNFAWSPDSRQIAFVSPAAAPLPEGHRLLIMDITTGKITHRLDAQIDLGSRIVWSPDGKLLAYECAFQSNTEVCTLDIATGKVRNISQGSNGDSGPAWSPDGHQLAFYSARGGTLGIYTVDRDGGHLRRVTDLSIAEWSPVWSPDGQRLAFVGSSGTTSNIYVVDADGSHLRALTSDRVDNWSPLWRP
jgi:TolB protein